MALITFCIVHYRRLPCLEKCIDSIEKYTSMDYEIKILRQEYQGEETESYVESLEKKKNIEIIRLDKNVGAVRSKGLLLQKANTPFIMILDNDVYVTESWLEPVLEIFKNEKDVGVVTFPRYFLDGSLQSVGGSYISIKNNVVDKVEVKMPVGDKEFIEVNGTGSGAIVMRKEVKNDFHFDPRYFVTFGDLDKDLQLLKSKWRKVVCLKSKVFHEPGWKSRDPNYLKVRFNYWEISRSYAKFRKKWGLRYPFKKHVACSLKFIEYPFGKALRILRSLPLIEKVAEKSAQLLRKASYR